MFNLIVVDDDEVVRNGLQKFIDWESMGFHLVNCFEDGREAIHFLKNNQVDVVLTDIDMLDINGLELSRYIYENFPLIKTIIISGYKSFDYAQQAIEYNVQHYLIKPTDISDIRAVFEKVSEELENRIQEKAEKKLYRKKYEDVLPLLKEQFLLNVFTVSIQNENDLALRLEAINLPQQLIYYPCSIIDISFNLNTKQDDQADIQFLKRNVQNFFHVERKGIHYMSFFPKENILRTLALATINNEDQFRLGIEKDVKSIKKLIQSNFGIALLVENRRMYPHLMKLTMSIEQPAHRTTLIVEDRDSTMEIKEYRDFIQQYKGFIPFIISGDIDSSENLLEKIFLQLEERPVQNVQRLIIDLFSMLTQTFVEKGMDIFEINNGEFSYHYVLNMDNIQQIKQWSKDCLYQFIEYYKEVDQVSSIKQIINKAKDYMKSNYHKDISLEDVAEHVFLNHVYFSRIFKENTGQNFSDYLTSIRMEKAIELLRENKYKTYEISAMVGYRSSKYFSKVFRQTTGCTPREYSRRFLMESKYI